MRRQGHDVLWVRIDCPGLNDAALLERVENERRILVTLDKDFWQLAVQRQPPLQHAKIILFRVDPAVPATLTPLACRVLAEERLWAARLAVVTPSAIEFFPTPPAHRP